MSARTQISYLSPSLAPSSSSTHHPRKLHRSPHDSGGNVLPPIKKPSKLSRTSSATGYQPEPSYTTGYSAYAQAGYGGGLSGELAGGSGRGTGYGRLQSALAQAKESRKARAVAGGRGRATVGSGGQYVDEEGVAHDSEYVQFRSAPPPQLHQPRSRHHSNGNAVPNDDDSASSSSESDASDASAFPSSPYTYQSTHRTTASSHHPRHHYPAKLGPTASAIPSYLSPAPHRTSLDYGGAGSSSLSVPRAPEPRRTSGEYDYSYDHARPTSTRLGVSKRSGGRGTTPQPHATTSSYQPPAPAFHPSTFGAPPASLRLPPKAPSSDAHSVGDSLGRLSLTSTTNAGESGYNKGASMRPPRTDGSAVDAGVHGMKRQWDGFKLDMRFGAHKAASKVSRKLNAII